MAWEQRRGLERRVVVRRREPGRDGAWNEAATIDTGTGALALEPRVTAAGDHVYVVWQETAPESQADAYFRRSTDDAKTWQAPLRLPARQEGIPAASMITIGGNANGLVLAAWEDRRSGVRDLFARRSTDFGGTWESSDVRLDADGPNGSGASYHPQLVLQENGNAHVVWWDEASGLSDVEVRSSADEGGSWKEIVRLDPGKPGEHASRDVAIASRGEILSVAWEDESGGIEREVIARQSTDSGKTWSPEVRMGRPRWAGSIEDPHVAVDGEGRTHVIWTALPAEETQPDEDRARAARSTNQPEPSSALFHAALDSRGIVLDPIAVPAAIPHSSLAWIGGSDRVLWMVWVGTPIDGGTIEAASSIDFGKTWRSSGLQRAQNPQGLFVPVPSFAAAVDATGRLHLTWVEGRPQRERLRFVRLEPAIKSGK